MTNLIQIIMAVFGAIGFSLIFNIHGKRIIATAAGGALTWGIYLLVCGLDGTVFTACMLATMATMFFAELMARIMKTPVIILLVPMLIPLVPGGDLYRMMSNLVMGSSEMTALYGRQLLMEVGGIAFGIILVSTALQVFRRIVRR